MKKGIVFNVERGSSEDGPGIRTVVFLKGCALRCRWCANPESQSARPEILYIANACVHCGACAELCPRQAITLREGFGYITDGARCSLCGKCVERCYANARKLQGVEYTSAALAEELLRDEAYFRRSGGGVTFSGGEPLLQAEFVCETAAALRERGIPSLVETCGFVPREKLQLAAEQTDAFYFDFKQADPEAHRRLTGQDNALILSNLEWLLEHFPRPVSVRYPYIPGCNDSEEDVRAFLRYMSRQTRRVEIVFLPYHRLGLPKYLGLGRTYEMGAQKSLKRDALRPVAGWAADYGLTVKIQ